VAEFRKYDSHEKLKAQVSGLACIEKYEKISPFAKGYQQRAPVYDLYHLLNHLNLFGAEHFSQVNVTIETIIANALVTNNQA